MTWTVYLSGEIHTDWREQIINGAKNLGLPTTFTSAITDHEASDSAGDMLEPESEGFWRDNKSKQWNAAFDAGYCAALGKPYVTLHDANIVHPLKEVDAAAMAWAQTPAQVVQVLKYVTGN